MKNKVKTTVSSLCAAFALYMSSVDYDIPYDAVVNPQLFNAIAFILGFAFLIVALDGLIKWDREDEGGLL